jgi:hypothetical protein
LCWKISNQWYKEYSKPESLVEVRDLIRKCTDPEEKKKLQKRKTTLEKRLDNLQRPEYLYVRVQADRLAYETHMNETGQYDAIAKEKYDTAREKGYRCSAEQLDTWASGKLQEKGLRLRAGRYAVRLFLNHYYEVGMRMLGRKPIKPYILTKESHHRYIPPPCWDGETFLDE